MAVKLWPVQPKDHENNGLGALERHLNDDPEGPYYIVAAVDRRRFTYDDDASETVPTIRIMHAEALFAEDAQAAGRLLRKAQEARIGARPRPAPTLPFGDSDGPGDENPGDETEPDSTEPGDSAGDLEPAAGRPPFLEAVTDDDTDGE